MVRTISELPFRRSVTITAPNEVTIQEPDPSNTPTTNSWVGYRRTIAIDGTSLTKDIANFPLTVYVPWTANMAFDGSDISFSLRANPSETSDTIPHEVIGSSIYNTFVVVVKVPIIKAASTTNLYLFYGGTPVVPDEVVWEDSARLVLHMDNSADTVEVDTTEYVTIYDPPSGSKVEMIAYEDDDPQPVTELTVDIDPAVDASSINMSGSLLIELAAGVQFYDPDTNELSDPYVEGPWQEDTDKQTPGAFELTSSGTYDDEEWNYTNPIGNLSLTPSLVEYEIALQDLGIVGTGLDLSNINYFRWYETNVKGAGTNKWIGVGRIRMKNPDSSSTWTTINNSATDGAVIRRDAVGTPPGYHPPTHSTIGQFLSSLEFQGVNDDGFLVSTSAVDISNRDFTLSGWVLVSVGFGPVKVWVFPQMTVTIDYAGTLSVNWNSSEVSASVGSGLCDGQFHHIVVRRSRSENTLDAWIDGVKYSIGVAGSDIKPETSDRLYIGSDGTAGSAKLFRGYLAEMLLFERALSEEWISLLYESQADSSLTFGDEVSASADSIPDGTLVPLGTLGSLYVSHEGILT